MGVLRVVVGGQYGSESKGAVTAWIARQNRHRKSSHAVVRVAGPNAGHTAYDRLHNRWALRQIPVAAVANERCRLVIAAGSEIDPPVLLDEIERLEAAGFGVKDRLVIDGQATVITDEHKVVEGHLVGAIGSTGKGIGAARADRLLRSATIWADVANEHGLDECTGYDTGHVLRSWARHGYDITIEGTQGYGLGLHAGNYPQVTSSDCTASDFLAMAGLPAWSPGLTGFQVWVVLRVYPIRVAGNSGPLKDETTWDELGLPPEYTTVTKKVRRVGQWDWDLAQSAIEANGGYPAVHLAVAMADQMFPEVAMMKGANLARARKLDIGGTFGMFMDEIESKLGAPVEYVGTGPETQIWGRGI